MFSAEAEKVKHNVSDYEQETNIMCQIIRNKHWILGNENISYSSRPYSLAFEQNPVLTYWKHWAGEMTVGKSKNKTVQ